MGHTKSAGLSTSSIFAFVLFVLLFITAMFLLILHQVRQSLNLLVRLPAGRTTAANLPTTTRRLFKPELPRSVREKRKRIQAKCCLLASDA